MPSPLPHPLSYVVAAPAAPESRPSSCVMTSVEGHHGARERPVGLAGFSKT